MQLMLGLEVVRQLWTDWMFCITK